MKSSLSFIVLALSVTLFLGIGCEPPPGVDGGDSGAGSAAPAPGGGGDSAAAPAGGAGSIKGMTKYAGVAPPRKPINVKADPNCLAANPTAPLSEVIVVGADGSLENVFVHVEGAPKTSAPATPVVLDQKGCVYTPHVFGIVAGQSLQITNSDGTNHNVNFMSRKNRSFNVAQNKGGKPLNKKMRKAEGPIPVKCNVHPWMNATAFVVDHGHFAATGSGGSFNLAGVPAGTYTLVAWHEKLGEQKQEVTVTAGGTAEVTFTFKAK